MSKRFRGFSLVEIVVVMGIFSILITSVAFVAIDTLKYSQDQQKKITATAMMQETVYGIKLVKQNSWNTLAENTDQGEMHLELVNGLYQIEPGAYIKDDITLKLELTNSEVPNVNTRVAVVTASWVSLTGQQNELQTKIHLTNWNTYSWHETSEADFNDGTNDNTIVSSFESEDFVTLAKEGENYFSAGTYTSNVFDSQSEDTNYFAIKWQSVDAPTSTLLIKVRASNQPDLEGAVWVDHEAGKLPAEVQNKKYFQYQAAFTSNGIEADVLNSIEINYK